MLTSFFIIWKWEWGYIFWVKTVWQRWVHNITVEVVPGSNQEILSPDNCLSPSLDPSLTRTGIHRHLDQLASYSERLKRISVWLVRRPTTNRFVLNIAVFLQRFSLALLVWAGLLGLVWSLRWTDWLTVWLSEYSFTSSYFGLQIHTWRF